ncbi:hypothetical protein Tco_1302691 [Tanacetum coccineum]
MTTLESCNKHNIVNWEYILLGMTEAKDSEVCKITRADGTSSFHGDFQALLRRLDRQDLFQLYSLVQERYKHRSIEGVAEINMLVDKKYPLKKMINLKIEAEEESNMASELKKFIKSQIAEQVRIMQKSQENGQKPDNHKHGNRRAHKELEECY